MGKREKLKQFHHNNILDAARKLFLEKGINQTTMDDIALAGEYSKSTLYAYFKSKDEIFAHLVLENTILLRDSIKKSIEQNKTMEAAYMAICKTHVDFQESNPLYFETMVGNITENQEENEINQAIIDTGNDINQIITKFLEEQIKNGTVKPDIDPLKTAFILWAGICGLITMTYNKASYVACMDTSKKDFLEYGFRTLLNTITP